MRILYHDQLEVFAPNMVAPLRGVSDSSGRQPSGPFRPSKAGILACFADTPRRLTNPVAGVRVDRGVNSWNFCPQGVPTTRCTAAHSVEDFALVVTAYGPYGSLGDRHAHPRRTHRLPIA